MNNPIIILTGNPWDRGRDMLTRLLIEHLLLVQARLLLIEPYWDRPRLALTYAGVVDSLEIPLADAHATVAASAMAMIPKLLEQPDDRYVLINLPGRGLPEIQHRLYECIAPWVEPLGLELTMAYVLGPSERSHDDLARTWELDLGSVADDCIAIPNAYYGDPRTFFWADSTLRRDGWLPMGEGERVLRRASHSVVQGLAACSGQVWGDGSPSAHKLPPRQLAGIRRWLDQHSPLAFRILYGPDYNRPDEEAQS